MKQILTIFSFLLIAASSFAFVVNPADQQVHIQDQLDQFNLNASDISVDEFLNMTPKKYKKMTGKRMGFKNAVKLKAAQKLVKKQMKKGQKGGDLSAGLYILLAIVGLGWIAMGIMSDWDGSDWIINLILTMLCWLPGVIHALVKKKDYY